MTRPVVVFCGPTISPLEVQERLDAVCLPPAVQGSIVAAVLHHDPYLIILIDGGFQSEPAIKHKEILWALSRGVTVVGASSMGALRAAELAPQMIGVGLIYRWFRRFALAADDAVAVQHGPAEVGFAPLTDALIDLRLTFRSAYRQKAISRDVATGLDNAARRLNFRDRTLAQCIADALPNVDAKHTKAVLERAYVRQKYRDAVVALDLARSRAFRPPPAPPPFVVTRSFVTDLTDAGFDPGILINL